MTVLPPCSRALFNAGLHCAQGNYYLICTFPYNFLFSWLEIYHVFCDIWTHLQSHILSFMLCVVLVPARISAIFISNVRLTYLGLHFPWNLSSVLWHLDSWQCFFSLFSNFGIAGWHMAQHIILMIGKPKFILLSSVSLSPKYVLR